MRLAFRENGRLHIKMNSEEGVETTMKNLKRVLSVFLACMLVLSLAACGKKDETTAESLMTILQDHDKSAHMAGHLNMTMNASQDGQSVSMVVDMDMETSGGVAHMFNGSITTSAADMRFVISLEGWTDMAAGESYMKTSVMGMDSGWMKSDIDDASMDVTKMAKLWQSGTEFTLRDRKKNEDYIVDWSISLDALQQALSGTIEDGIMSGTASLDVAGLTGCTGTAVFAADSKQPRSVVVDITGSMIEKFQLALTFDIYGGDPVVLSVPQDVIDSARDPEIDDLLSDSSFSVDGGSDAGTGGYDEVIDPLYDELQADMPANCSASIDRWSDRAELDFKYDAGATDWYGNVEICHFPESGAQEYFTMSSDFYGDWYEKEPVDSGPDYAIYHNDGELNYVCIVDDMTIDATVYGPGDYDVLMGNLSELLAMCKIG